MKATASPGIDWLSSQDPVPPGSLRAGLVGRAIGPSLTPGMHEAEGRRLGLDYDYLLLDFDRMGLPDQALGSILEGAARQGFAGVNVTYPFKQAVVPLLDALSPEAAAIGAVNAVVFAEGRAVGHNTDCWGFAESFRRGMAGVRLDSVVLIGAGGGGHAVARALLDLGAAEIAVFDLESARSESLAKRLATPGAKIDALPLDELPRALERADGTVNATPAGMDKYPGLPLPAELLRPDQWVADIVYFPERTALLQQAASIGCRTLTGRGMAIFQAVRAFELFTGRRPDPERMSDHFRLLQS